VVDRKRITTNWKYTTFFKAEDADRYPIDTDLQCYYVGIVIPNQSIVYIKTRKPPTIYINTVKKKLCRKTIGRSNNSLKCSVKIIYNKQFGRRKFGYIYARFFYKKYCKMYQNVI